MASFRLENRLWKRGYKYILGIDEVGRGAWAGPIILGGIIFPPRVKIRNLVDSKKLTSKQREKLSQEIKEKALFWLIQKIGVSSINCGLSSAIKGGILKLLKKTQKKIKIDFILFDNTYLPSLKIPFLNIVEGDQKISTIAAASIIALEIFKKRDPLY